jgi:serine/threonine protein phosphatase PrpC
MKVRPGAEVASLSDVGCQRENNEDSYSYWESPDDSTFALLGRLAIVADGMGGCEGGQFASRIAVESVEQIYSSSAESDPQQRLLQGFREAHARIQQRARENPELHGMGTTLTAFAAVGDRSLYYAHIGDSRLYLLRAGKLHLVTHDHSLVSRLVETGIIRAEDADNHPQKHVLTAAVGIAEENQPDSGDAPVPLKKTDVLLLCTDGLWGQVSEPELEQILASQAPSEACRSLVQLAKDRGGPDNITLQIARLS